MGQSCFYRIPLILALLSGFALADQCQITSPLPVPVTINGCTFSGSLPNNSTSYIQNTLSPTTTTQIYSVEYGSNTAGLNLGYITGAECLTTDSVGNVIGTGSACGSGGGGGGASTLEVFVGSARSSPTASITANTSQFAGSVTGSTFTFNINPAMATIAISTASLQTQITATGVSTGSLQGQINNVYTASATFTTEINTLNNQFPVSLSTNTMGILPVANGGTATASPGLIAGTNITSITGTWPNQTINAATQSSGGGGGSPLAVTTGTATTYSNPAISSPTAVIVYDQNLFKVTLPGATTAFVTSISTITAASLGALTGNQTITLSGDSTGSGATAIAVTAASTQGNIKTFTQPISFQSSATVLGSLGEYVTYNISAGSITDRNLSASLPVQTDGSENLISAAIDLSGSQTTGILGAGRFPALTGDITTSAGSLTTTAAANQTHITSITPAATLVLGSAGQAVQISSNAIIGPTTIYANITPTLVAGTNITSITGTWPNQTINAATQGGTGQSFFLAVTTGTSPTYANPAISSSSVTTNLIFNQSQMLVTNQAGTTDYISINASSATMAGPPATCGDTTHALSYSGTAWGCQAITAAASPGGVEGNVQYNHASAIAGSADFNIWASSIVTGQTYNDFLSTITVSSATFNASLVTIGQGVSENIAVSTGLYITDGGNAFTVYPSTGFVLTVSTSVTSSTLSPISNFYFVAGTTETWVFDCQYSVTGASGGTEFGINGPSNTTVMGMVFGDVGAVGTFSTAVVTALNTADTVAFATVAAAINVTFRGEITTGNTAGAIIFQRKAFTAGTTNTMNAGSECIARRIL